MPFAFSIPATTTLRRVVAINIPASCRDIALEIEIGLGADASPRPLPQADCILITRHQPRVKTIVQELRPYALCDGLRRNGVYFISRT